MTTVADATWTMLAESGVKRCYGIIGDALNPVIDALHRGGKVEFILVRNEEAGTLAAVAESLVTGEPVVVCGTAGPGVTHLLNGLLDASRERVPVIAVAGDSASSVIDSGTVEEVSPYDLFRTASLYTGRILNPAQTRTVVQTAIRTAIVERGPTVISIPEAGRAQQLAPRLRAHRDDGGRNRTVWNGAEESELCGSGGRNRDRRLPAGEPERRPVDRRAVPHHVRTSVARCGGRPWGVATRRRSAWSGAARRSSRRRG